MPGTRNLLKMLAIIFMVIDHVGAFLLGNNIVCRAIGRLAFPLFVYLLADGFRRTRNVEKYARRLLLFWVISIVPYSLVCSGGLGYTTQNVFASLYLYLGLYCVLGEEKVPVWMRCTAVPLFAVIAWIMRLEYSWYGVLVAVIMFYASEVSANETFIYLAFSGIAYGISSGFYVQPFSAISAYMLPLYGQFQESERPSRGMSMLTYLFYPVHLLFLAMLRI